VRVPAGLASGLAGELDIQKIKRRRPDRLKHL